MELQAGRGGGEARPREEGDWKEDGNRKGKNKKRGVSTLGRKTCASLVSPAQDFFFFLFILTARRRRRRRIISEARWRCAYVASCDDDLGMDSLRTCRV
jgi:hypothetical protein